MVTAAQTQQIREAVSKAKAGSGVLQQVPTLTSGSSFEFVKRLRNEAADSIRQSLINEGFDKAEVERLTEGLFERREATRKTPGAVERRQARLKPFEKKQREEAKGKVVNIRLEKARRLAEINKQLREGQITTREAQRLRQDPSLARGTVRALTVTKVTKIFQKVPFKSITDIEREKAVARVERVRETRKQQLRKAGAEVIFKPSEKFFGLVPTGIGAVTKIPTETELVRELKAQKGFVTFIAPEKEGEPKKKVEISIFKPILVESLKKDKLLLGGKDDKSRISRELTGDRGIGFRDSKFQILAKKSEEIERAEKTSREGFRRIEQLASFLTLGEGKPIEERSFIGQTLQNIITFPLSTIPVLFVKFPLEARRFGTFLGGAIVFPESREEAKKQLTIDAPKEVKKVILEVINPTTPVGLATFLSVGVFTRIKTKGKTQAQQVLQQIAREKPPTIKGDLFFKFKKVDIDVVTGLVIKKPGKITKIQTGIVTPPVITTTVRALQPKVIGAVAESVGGATKFRTFTIGGVQRTTATKITRKGTEFFIRSETELATGKTTTKVFRGDKLLRTIKSTEKPTLTFTEPIKRISVKDVLALTEPSRLIEVTRALRTAKGISLIRKGFVPKGKVTIVSQEVLGARIQRPAITTRAVIEVNVATGKTKLIPKSVLIEKEIIKFVDFPVKQKPFVFERLAEGVLVKRPSTILTTQITRLKAPFEITFAKRVKPGKEVKPPKQTVEEILLERIKARPGEITLKDVRTFLEPPIPPTKVIIKKPTTLKDVKIRLEQLRKERDILLTKDNVQKTRDLVIGKPTQKAKTKAKEKVREVQRPAPLQLPKFKQKFFLPEIEEVFLRGAKPIAVPVSIQKGVQRQIQQLTPKQIQQLRIVQEQRIKQEQRLIQQPRLAEIQKQIQEQRLIQQPRLAEIQKQIQEQRIIQEQRLIQEPRLTEVQRIIQQQRLAQEQRVIQQQKLVEVLKVPTAKIPITIVPPLRIITPGVRKGFFFFLPDFPGGTGVSKPAFTTEVREGERKGDKFIRVRKQVLPRQRAINLGARIADNTTARTFKIKRKGTTTLSDTNRFPLKDKFRGRVGKSKLPPKVFVEKSKFAIDSPGERLGIPFSPIRIPRLKEAIARKKARRILKALTTGRGRTMVFL